MPSRPGLKFIHRQDGPVRMMIQANTLCSDGKPSEAVAAYTEVIYKESPGYVPALLNRSLAHIALNHPELAVTDAYLAGIAISEWSCHDNSGSSNRLQATCKYLRTEMLETATEATWTKPHRRRLGGNVPQSPLATLLINDVPEAGYSGARFERFDVHRRHEVYERLKVRALYRLCAALHLCGGGARYEALALIDDTLAICNAMQPWESVYFHRLGDDIMSDMVDQVERESNTKSATAISEKENKSKLQQSAKERMTKVKLHGYKWDTWEPALQHGDWQRLLGLWIKKCAPNCSARFMGTLVVYDGKSKPYVELAADIDFPTGSLILTEHSILHVTTAIPEEAFEKETMFLKEAKYYCDTCATLLLVPGICPVTYSGSTHPLSPNTEQKWETDSMSIDVSTSRKSTPTSPPPYRNTPIDPILISQPSEPNPSLPPSQPLFSPSPSHSPSPSPFPIVSLITPPPPPHRTAPPPQPDFKLCCPTHRVPTCSSACAEARKAFDRGLCHTSIERNLRESHYQNPITAETRQECHKTCLRDLLFLRTMATALNTGKHPLHIQETVFAAYGCSCHVDEGDAKEDWSFATHVVRPLYTLHALFESLGLDPLAHIEKTDGWVVNTLLSKLGRGMRVAVRPGYVKRYDEDGVVASGVGGFVVGESMPGEGSDEDIAVGSVTPVFDMVRIADAQKGEQPNVCVVRKEGVEVYAAADIKAGEVLLRAADGAVQPKIRGVGGELRRGRAASAVEELEQGQRGIRSRRDLEGGGRAGNENAMDTS